MERTLSTTIDLKHQMPESDINKYITDINELGIKIHPKIWQEDSNYLQLNGEGAYIKNSDNDLLAEFTANNMQIGQEKNGYSRIEITKYGLDVKVRIEGSDIELAHMGPGKSANKDGSISNKVPYYSIGLRENSANDYDLNSTYKKGDICTYNNEVYICNTEISIPEAWNSSHWRFAVGGYSNAEGYRTIASGVYSHAEGIYTKALGSNSHAEGLGSKSLGDNSHAEGQSSESLGDNSHAEGYQSEAIGYSSHTEGSNTYAEGDYAHAEGIKTYASGPHSHAQNFYTIAGYDSQTVIGKYNDNQSNNAFEIGNGENKRSNAFTVDWDGKVTAYPTSDSNGIGFKVQHGIDDKDSGIETTRTDTNVVAMFGIGAGGLNHGIYSRKLDKWLIRGDDTNVYINQDVNISSQTANKVLASPNGSTGKPNFRALVAADIPNLDAGKITSGAFGADRIPNLNASKITAGTLGADRIPNLNASKITVGTLGAARLPDIVKIVSETTSAFSLAGGAGFYKDVSISVPSGYTLVGCVGAISSHNQAVYIGSMYKSGTSTIRISGRNSGTSAFSDMTVTVYGLCVNSNVVG